MMCSIVCTKIARAEGIRGFYRGFSAVVLGAIPGNMCYFGGYELGKDLVRKARSVDGSPIPLDGFWGDAITGMVAQLVAGLAFTPMDVIKERMQVQVGLKSTASWRHYKGSFINLAQLVSIDRRCIY